MDGPDGWISARLSDLDAHPLNAVESVLHEEKFGSSFKRPEPCGAPF
jgi:hypothetical protein